MRAWSVAECPCGTGRAYPACCGPLHDGAAAETAEQLMRARYAAYALGETGYLVRSWHPRTRPDPPPASDGLTWTGLEVLRTVDGGPADEAGTVEFVAEYDGPTGAGRLHEVSRFERRRGAWVYVEPCPPYR